MKILEKYSGGIVYNCNGWPVIKAHWAEMYSTPLGNFRNLDELRKALKEEPDFIIPLEYGNDVPSYVTTYVAGYYATVGGAVPTLPEAFEYLSENRPVPPDKVLPGLHSKKFTYDIYRQFSLDALEKYMNGQKIEFGAKKAVIRNVPFREAIVDVILPWKYVKDDISSVTLEKMDEKHYVVKKEFPFGHWSDIKSVYYRKYNNEFRDDLKFFGWGEDYAFIIQPLGDGYDFAFVEKPPRSPYAKDFQRFFGVPSNEVKHYRIREEEFKDVEKGGELIDFLTF